MDRDGDSSHHSAVQVTVREFDGEGNMGKHGFAYLPRRGEVVKLWTGGRLLVARVVDVVHEASIPLAPAETFLLVDVR